MAFTPSSAHLLCRSLEDCGGTSYPTSPQELPVVFTSAVPSLRVASYLFPSKPPALGTWQECLPPPFPPPLQLPTTDLPQTGQPAQPKIATANKEMSSLGLLSSAGAHFFQLGFKLRNTSVCLVSARCQHFCSACSGATGRLMNSVGRLRETILYLFFFSPLLGIREHFQFTS